MKNPTECCKAEVSVAARCFAGKDDI